MKYSKANAVHGLKDFKTGNMSIEGMEDLVNNLNLMPRDARNLMRSSVHGIAGKVRDVMRKRAPKETGTLRKAIGSVRLRGTPTRVESGVRITKGAGAKYDAWYWHFVEWGTQLGQEAQPFVNPSIEEMRGKIPGLIKEEVGKKLEAMMARRAKAKKK